MSDPQDLDTQYTIGVATGVPTIFISCGENNKDGLSGFLDQINFLLGQTNPPQVLTTSYGQNENTVSRATAASVSFHPRINASWLTVM